MEKHKITQLDRIARYADLIQKQAGKAVRPYRADGYVNMMTRYGTQKDASEQYKFVPEDAVPDELLTMYYEGNGLFAKIIDTPAEEAIKHGFELKDVSDQTVEDFYTEALDELDWEETAMTAIKWARLFGGSLAVMLINDGRGLDEPLDWRHIQSIDDIRVFDRSVIQPDYTTLFNYDPRDPFSTRGSRLGLPEYYQIFSKYGSFTVHDSRCLVFQNGILPENTTNSIYQLWGVPEYIRLHRAIRDAEVAHRSAPKMLDRSVQPIYKMQNLAAELATEEGESKVLRRLQVIDMARGLLNSLVIDAEGEDYDFKTFQFSGINDVVSASCNMLSALSNIPQTILFGQAVGGMSSTDDTSMENYYNYVERIQRRMLKSNLRYLLSIIFQAGLATGEVDEVPKIKIKFNPLWSLSDVEQADLEQKREQTKFTRAQTAQIYVNMQAIDPSEVRQKLADSEEFDVEAMLDEYDDDELFPDQIAGETPVDTQGQPVQPGTGTSIFEEGDFAEYGQDVSVEEHNADPETGGNAPAAAPAATKLPQDMSAKELAEKEEKGVGNTDEADGIINGPKESVGVLVISDGKVLSGTRHNDFGYGLVCGPGGHVEPGETPTQAAFRETEEEFGISPKELIPLGLGPYEPDTGLRPHLYLCTDYDGEPNCLDLEMTGAKFRTLDELDELAASMFQPFADGLKILKTCIDTALFFGDDEGEMHDDLVDSIGKAVVGDSSETNISENTIDKSAPKDTIKYQETIEDGGPGSGNFGHKGRPGETGGSAPDGSADSSHSTEKNQRLKDGFKHLKPNQKYAYLSRSGVIPKSELESLKEGVRTGDKAALDRLDEFEAEYFEYAEYGPTVKSLDVEMRDEVAAMSDAEAAAWAKRSMDRRLESHEGWANQFSSAQKVAIDMGVFDTPQVVSQEDFDKFVSETGAAVCFRGVKDIDSMTGENMQFQMAYNTQEPYYGDGIFGDGLYFSTKKSTAESYTGRAEISTCAVRPDAKILEYGSPEHERAKRRVQTADNSVAALCSGYYVIRKKMGQGEDYYVILNRAALVMVDPVGDLADVALKAADRNAAKSGSNGE